MQVYSGMNSQGDPCGSTNQAKNITTPIAKLTRGPAAAVRNSCQALWGMRSRLAHPPMTVRVMSRVRQPKHRAVSEWPSSWATMEMSSITMQARSIIMDPVMPTKKNSMQIVVMLR